MKNSNAVQNQELALTLNLTPKELSALNAFASKSPAIKQGINALLKEKQKAANLTPDPRKQLNNLFVTPSSALLITGQIYNNNIASTINPYTDIQFN